MLFNVGKINWKDATQNLLIALICISFGAFGGYKMARNAQNDVIKQLIPTIEKAIDKETIMNKIENKINVEIDKIKKSDSLNINIIQTPDNKQEPVNVIIKKSDSIPKKKKGFFKRLFSKG